MFALSTKNRMGSIIRRASELFKRAQKLEKTALDNDYFYLGSKETLGDLIKPERVKKIKEDFKIRLEGEENKQKRLSRNPFLDQDKVKLSDIEEVYGDDISSSCLVCHK